MHSPKNYLLVFLGVTTIGVSVMAWRQNQELIALRAAAMDPKERATWQKRVWDAEKRRTDLEAQVASQHEMTEPGSAGPDAEREPDGPVARQRGPRNDFRNDFAAMMDRPEVQRLMALQQRAALDARYANLFKSLNLSPEQLEKFKNLLVEKSTAVMDVLAAAREQGTNPRTDRETYRKLIADTQADVDSSIRSALGETAYSQYKDYEKTLPQRNLVDQLAQRLSYSSTPLSAEQSAQMVKILETTGKVQGGGGNRIAFAGPGPAGVAIGANTGNVRVTDATINQSLGVLAAPQIEALRQLQAEQQAQTQLNSEIRKQFQESRATSRGGAPSPPPAGG